MAATGGDGEPTGEVGVDFSLEVRRVEDDGKHVACFLSAIGVGGEGWGRWHGDRERGRIHRVGKQGLEGLGRA